ncbi:MAG: hypothetical protein Q8R25_03720, partial [bacterium]|nr:hypothetical protein [bacterium]
MCVSLASRNKAHVFMRALTSTSAKGTCVNPSENLIVVPVYVKKGDEEAKRQITERIEELS